MLAVYRPAVITVLAAFRLAVRIDKFAAIKLPCKRVLLLHISSNAEQSRPTCVPMKKMGDRWEYFLLQGRKREYCLKWK